MTLTGKERQNLINTIQYGMFDLARLMDEIESNEVVFGATAGILDVFQVLLREINNSKIKEQEIVF